MDDLPPALQLQPSDKLPLDQSAGMTHASLRQLSRFSQTQPQRIVEELTEAGTAGEEGRKRRVFALQSRHALFPQVFRVVEEYVRRKVDFNGAPEPEVPPRTAPGATCATDVSKLVGSAGLGTRISLR